MNVTSFTVPRRDETVVNAAAYRFVTVGDPGAWIGPLQGRAAALGLKGTILVATEGINLFLAGRPAAVDTFVDWLATDPLFVDADRRPLLAGLRVRRSTSATQPFRRLKVRQRSEIVTLRRPAVQPALRRAPGIAAPDLARWLDQAHDDDGRPLTLLDTRNAFEVAAGTLRGARHLDLPRFDAFPDAVEPLLDALRDETVVTFCTGGIRCEKAALYLQDRGLTRVLQLDGGILEWFAEVGDAHWDGTCFVFDERVALTSDLAPAGPTSARVTDQSPDRSPASEPSAARARRR